MRRIVARLLEKEMIVERSRGALSTAGGTLKNLSDHDLPERIARSFVASSNFMIRLGAVTAREKA